MGSDYSDGSGDTRSKRLIQDRQERLEAVLDMFSQQAAEVTLSPQMKREIAVHIVNYHRVLSKFEGESVLSDDDIPDISPIRDRLGRTTSTVTSKATLGGGWQSDDVPKIDELDFWYLESVANELEAAAKKLGFWAAADTDVDTDDFSEEDLATLLDARGQDDAIEDAPDDILDRVIDTEVDGDGD
jgi:hypothetical protein